ncbi:MAG: helix-turn-helix domain-containing protein [Ruminococcus sp.]
MRKTEKIFCSADENELVVLTVKKGMVSVEYGSGSFTLASGQAIILHSGMGICTFESLNNSEIIILGVEGNLVSQVMEERIREGRLFCCTFLPQAVAMAKVLESDQEKSYEYSVAAYRFLMELYDAAQCYREESGYPLLVQTAIGMIEEECAYLDGVSEIAERLEITESHLIRIFSRSVGVSPGKYLKRCRIAFAKTLLIQPEITVSLAAQMSGFSSADYFSKSFRKETGLTPGEFVRLCTGKQNSSKKAHTLIDEAYL